MSKQPIYIAFATQKGGAGKSNFTTLCASISHYMFGYNVAVVDCDFPQLSVYNQRKRELEKILTDNILKKAAANQFSELKKNAYSIISSKGIEAIEKAEEISKTEKLDYIFFDLPGTVNQTGIFELICNMDYIFTPITADRTVIESSLSFLTILQQLYNSGKTKVKTYAFWNMVDGREKTNLYDAYAILFNDYKIPLLETTIPYLARFHKEIIDSPDSVFKSTLLRPSRAMLSGSRVMDLCNEIVELINEPKQ